MVWCLSSPDAHGRFFIYNHEMWAAFPKFRRKLPVHNNMIELTFFTWFLYRIAKCAPPPPSSLSFIFSEQRNPIKLKFVQTLQGKVERPASIIVWKNVARRDVNRAWRLSDNSSPVPYIKASNRFIHFAPGDDCWCYTTLYAITSAE